MSEDVFQLVEEALRQEGPESALDMLAERFLAEKRYPQLFETRLMKKRHELGLPLLQSELPDDFPPGPRKEYEDAFVAAAREAGNLFLENAEIERAWPYFRALGDNAPVAEAIERIEPGEGLEEHEATMRAACCLEDSRTAVVHLHIEDPACADL